MAIPRPRLRRCGGVMLVLLRSDGVRPRAKRQLAFRPALFTPDSFGYMAQAMHPSPGAWHPAGYAGVLWLLAPWIISHFPGRLRCHYNLVV